MEKVNLNPNNPLMGIGVPLKVIDIATNKVTHTFNTTSKAKRTLGLVGSLYRKLKEQENKKEYIPVFSKTLDKYVYIKKSRDEKNT